MTVKDREPDRKKGQRVRPDAEDRTGAPSGRGGAAMGRTVGLPFGGGRPRKRKRTRPLLATASLDYAPEMTSTGYHFVDRWRATETFAIGSRATPEQ